MADGSSVRYEIIVDINGTKQYLDTTDVDSIQLQFKVSDILDPTSVDSSFSKTLTLPETSHNRWVFGNISNLGSDSQFNQNLKTPCQILVDSFVVFQGNLQLKNVQLNIDKNITKYECVVYADNRNLFIDIGEKFLTDLDFSAYNHIYNISSITHSWAATSSNYGYYYPLIDYGNGWIAKDLGCQGGTYSLKTEQFYPSTYAKPIWDRIFLENGYDYNFKNASQDFIDRFENRLMVPFNQSNLIQGATFSSDKIFRIGLAANWQIKTPGTTLSVPSYGVPLRNYVTSPPTNYLNQSNGVKIQMGDENPPNGDPNGFYNNTVFEYTNATLLRYKQRFTFALKVRQLFLTQTPYINQIRVNRQCHPDTGVPDPGFPLTGYPIAIGGDYHFDINSLKGAPQEQVNVNPNTFDSTFTINFSTNWLDNTYYSQTGFRNTPLFPGERVSFTYDRNWNTYGSPGYTISNIYGGYDIPANTVTDIFLAESYFYNEIDNAIVKDGSIQYNGVIPRNVKQKDFILWIQKMFNLVFEPDKDFPTIINITPRDDYFDSGEIKNWTNRIDPEEVIKEQIIADQQNREFILKYKDDKDFYNQTYTDAFNYPYGQLRYISENEFIKGTKKIEIGFSPTPVARVEGTFAVDIPLIYKIQNNIAAKTDFNIRILQKTQAGVLALTNDIISVEGKTYSYYPYVGHFDNPYNAQDDINFDQVFKLYYPQTIVTDNNLYRQYYYRFIQELYGRESRLVTLKMNLSPEDIAKFKFNDKIYLVIDDVGQYYKVNKIDGYDPSKLTTTTVELIKSLSVTIPKTQQLTIPSTTTTTTVAEVDITNNVLSSRVTVTGENNYVSENESIVVGTNNTSNSRYGSIIGDNNFISQGADNVSIFGNNNKVFVSATGSFVVGNNISVYDPNTIVLSGTALLYNNFIDAGTDEILNAFPDNKIVNVIDASTDVIRELGSQSIENQIDAGTDQII